LKSSWKARQGLRLNLDGLLGSLEHEIQADLLNISLLGLSVRTPVALQPGQRLRCMLGEEPDIVSVRGDLVWCSPAKANLREVPPQGHFDTGIRFDEDLLDKARDLLNFLDKSTIVKLSKGVFGRFELEYEVPIRLRQRREVRLKQISYSGIEAETRVSLIPDSQIDLELPLDDRRFFSPARVVWVQKASDNEELLRLGAEFLQPTQRHLEILKGFIEKAS